MDPREPQGPIQYGLEGLIGLLGLKGLAQNPNTMQGFIQPTLDMFPFITNRAREVAAGTIPLEQDEDGLHYPFGPSPPTGETWLILNVTGSLNVDGPNQECWRLGITQKIGPVASFGSIIDITDSPGHYTSGANIIESSGMWCNVKTPFWLNSGETIGLNISGFVHAGVDSSATGLFTYIRCRI